MDEKNYVSPIVNVIPLLEKDVVRASILEDGDHIVQPGSNWGGILTPNENGTGF